MYNLMSMIKVQVDIDKCFLLRSSPVITRKSFNCESVQCCHRKTSMSMKVFNLRVKFFASPVHACALRLSVFDQENVTFVLTRSFSYLSGTHSMGAALFRIKVCLGLG